MTQANTVAVFWSENTRVTDGKRYCRACVRRRTAAYRARKVGSE